MNQIRNNDFLEQPAALTRVQLALAVLAALVIWLAFSRFSLRIHNDDAMRLVQVRDLLAGQGWLDMTQYRLGLEGGTAMHWSRLVDAPIAGLILIFQPILGTAQAEVAAMIVWPGVLFALTILALAAICHRLGGGKAALYGSILGSVMVAQSGKFDPGSLDHHNLQILLLVTALAGFVYRRLSTKYAVMSGLALALSIGIGIETLPLIAVICVAFAAVWALRGDAERMAALGFSFALFGGLAAVYHGTAPFYARLGGFCDAISFDLVLPALLGAAGLGALSVMDLTRGARFAALFGLAVVIAGTLALLAPACLGSPLETLDPQLREKWLAKVGETKSLAEQSSDRLGFFAGGVMGLLIALRFMVRDARWEVWGVLATTIAAALALTAFQSRGFPVMATLSILPTAVLASRLGSPQAVNEREWSGLVTLCAVILSVPAFTSAAVANGVALIAPRERAAPIQTALEPLSDEGGTPCTSAADMAGLAALPQGTVSAPSYFGAHILMHTPHRTLAAPYHRNQAGLLAQIALAEAPPADTHALLKTYGVDYIIRCESDGQFAGENPGLASHLAPNHIAEFLTRMDAPGPLSIYRVR